MKKYHIILGVLVFIALLIFIFGSRYGLKFGNVIISPQKNKVLLHDMTYKFWEDIQFKDFTSAAQYHEEHLREKLDIPYLIERIFYVKPEFLDIRTIDILEVHIDSSGERGRVLTRLLVRLLNTGETEEPEVVVYWYTKNGQWFMRLESSLRKLKDSKKQK